ncbi:hypothetical protein NDU88_011783, partial [Pleurodeles waltl]
GGRERGREGGEEEACGRERGEGGEREKEGRERKRNYVEKKEADGVGTVE